MANRQIALLLVVDNHLMKRLAVFVNAVHRERRGFAVIGDYRFALCSASIDVPNLLVGVRVEFFNQHRGVVSALNADGFSGDWGVLPCMGFAIRTDLVNVHSAVGIDRAFIDLRRRSGKFRFGEIHFPLSGKNTGRHRGVH